MEIITCPYCGEPLHDYWGVLRCQHCRRWIMEEELALWKRAQPDGAVLTSHLSSGDRTHLEQAEMGGVERTRMKKER
jgi:uncharacterized Zn finger protein (UPF0148 family)